MMKTIDKTKCRLCNCVLTPENKHKSLDHICKPCKNKRERDRRVEKQQFAAPRSSKPEPLLNPDYDPAIDKDGSSWAYYGVGYPIKDKNEN